VTPVRRDLCLIDFRGGRGIFSFCRFRFQIFAKSFLRHDQETMIPARPEGLQAQSALMLIDDSDRRRNG